MRKSTVFVFTFLCILTFASCSKSNNPAWTWAQELEQKNILSVAPWRHDEAYIAFSPLNDVETLELIELLKGLPKDSFTENKQLAGITPTFGIQITTASGICRINEANAPNGALEIICDETQWWIDSAELAAFVRRITDSTLTE